MFLTFMVFFLFGLVKLIFGLPKSEEYLPEGLPGILKFCEPGKHHAKVDQDFRTAKTGYFQNGKLVCEILCSMYCVLPAILYKNIML